MLLLKVLSVIAFLPSLYPICKFFRKEELNIFDLIILFHSLYFCVIPISSDIDAYKWLDHFLFEPNVVTIEFLYYLGFALSMLFVDIYWSSKKGKENSIFNITSYIKLMPNIEISYVLLLLLGINVVISVVWYLPQASYFAVFQEYNVTNSAVNNQPSALFLFYDGIFGLCVSFSILLFFKVEKFTVKHKLISIMMILYIVILFFMPRRVMIAYLIIFFLILYSINRNFFSLKKLLWFFVCVVLILKFYFPFYNVLRFSVGNFDIDRPITSSIELIEDACKNFNKEGTEAEAMSDGRALNLYYALYRIIKYDNTPSNGGLLVSAIDYALPKVINPNKGAGTAEKLEKKMRISYDQADSFLLLAYGDFGVLGGSLYAVFLYLLVLSCYAFIYKCCINVFPRDGLIIGILIVCNLINLSFNVEGRLDGCFASIIKFPLFVFILVLLGRLKILYCKSIK